MKGNSTPMVIGDRSMGMTETNLPNATLGAMPNLMEILQQSIRHDSGRIDCMWNQAVHLATHDKAIQVVGPTLPGIMHKTITP